MDIHLISGFLGSGKTTTIIALCKYLMDQGKKVAVVTNDQGKYLVDTAFILASDIPALEVQSGCFCSNYQDLVEQLEELDKTVDPDIVFAESIGSAGNLVGTVIKPLMDKSVYQPSSLSSLVDARLFLRLARGEHLPFSDSVVATFKGQLTESDLLIINKIDLLSSEDIDEIIIAFPSLFGTKEFLLHSALSPENIRDYYALISSIKTKGKEDIEFDQWLHQKSLDRLKWHERSYELSRANNVKQDIVHIIETMLTRLKKTNRVIAHIKILIKTSKETTKISITSLNESSWRSDLATFNSNNAELLVNARIHSDTDIDDIFV